MALARTPWPSLDRASSHSPTSFDSPYGDSGRVGSSSVTRPVSRRAVDRSAGGEHEPGHVVRGHRLQQGDHAGDVLGIGVQRSAHRNPGVLEAGEMHDAGDGVFGEDLVEELAGAATLPT